MTLQSQSSEVACHLRASSKSDRVDSALRPLRSVGWFYLRPQGGSIRASDTLGCHFGSHHRDRIPTPTRPRASYRHCRGSHGSPPRHHSGRLLTQSAEFSHTEVHNFVARSRVPNHEVLDVSLRAIRTQSLNDAKPMLRTV
jgi:hypothetical protein